MPMLTVPRIRERLSTHLWLPDDSSLVHLGSLRVYLCHSNINPTTIYPLYVIHSRLIVDECLVTFFVFTFYFKTVLESWKG